MFILHLKRERRSSVDEDNDGSVSERDSIFEEEEVEEDEDEEEDASVLSSLDNYQLCLKYQQVQLLDQVRFTLSNPD